uniref:Uncharacterized protein n=1 Tax=Arundo donax TaxID=35708 RepID=A0A0A8Y7I1_ARUDO
MSATASKSMYMAVSSESSSNREAPDVAQEASRCWLTIAVPPPPL